MLLLAILVPHWTPSAPHWTFPASRASRITCPAICLDKQEVADKLNEVPVFAVADAASQPMAAPDAESGIPVITFHLDILEAQKSLAAYAAANPGTDARLMIVPLGSAYSAMSAQQGNAQVRLQPSQAEYNNLRQSMGFPAEDASKGQPLIPLYSSDALSFESDQGGKATPIFFGVDDFRTAWVESGQSAEELPGLALTDLRTLAYNMEHDASTDWSGTVLMPPEAGVAYARGESQRE